MDSGGNMGHLWDGSGFFADADRKEAARQSCLQVEKIISLKDQVDDLKHRLADQLVEIDRLTQLYNKEHRLRTQKRSFLDWIIGYVG